MNLLVIEESVQFGRYADCGVLYDSTMLREPGTLQTGDAAHAGAFHAYGPWAHALLGDLRGACVLDGTLAVLESWGRMDGTQAAARARELGWGEPGAAHADHIEVHQTVGHSLLPVLTGGDTLLGVLALEHGTEWCEDMQGLTALLSPLRECLRRQLQAFRTQQTARHSLIQHHEDLQWLVQFAASARSALSGRQLLNEMLSAATVRMGSLFGAVYVPDRHFCLEYCGSDDGAIEEVSELWRRSRTQLSVWVQHKRRPLVLSRRVEIAARCKILLAPVASESGPVSGVMAFCRPRDAHDYRQRHLLLARHLGRLAAGMLEGQFDAMTGLYTREGLDQVCMQVCTSSGEAHSVLYLDVDQMHVVNELYGFEIGNELLVRVADILSPPHLPDGAFAARIAADRFAVLLTRVDTPEAATVAEGIQKAIHGLAIGPLDNPIDVSVSCGVAALLSMPHALPRALAAGELACKTAKKRGRSRLKVDSCDDGTMLRGHVDAVIVGQLRTALRADQLLLYAQRIAPLREPAQPDGYEILLRLNDPTEGVVLPGTLVQVAQRYQLLPLIDRWVVRKTLQMLAAHRNLLKTRGIHISINLSGQSIGDEEFTRQLGDALSAAQLPPGTVTFEITEQVALNSLARAEEMIRILAPWQCRFALDDFGTGSNSLAYLNALPIARVKIDGAFVRDILTNPRSQATVHGIVELARGFGIDTVAEFVENLQIAERVRELGVDYGQGYAFGRPEPFDVLLADLERREPVPQLMQA